VSRYQRQARDGRPTINRKEFLYNKPGPDDRTEKERFKGAKGTPDVGGNRTLSRSGVPGRNFRGEEGKMLTEEKQSKHRKHGGGGDFDWGERKRSGGQRKGQKVLKNAHIKSNGGTSGRFGTVGRKKMAAH